VIDRDFAALQQVAEDSVLWTAACAIGDSVHLSWTHSRLAKVMSRIGSSIAIMPVAGRIRVVAMTTAWAALGYGAGLAIAPPYVRSAIPPTAMLALAVVALVVSIGAEGFARSWRQSWLRGLLN
jgi:hypothetical protein